MLSSPYLGLAFALLFLVRLDCAALFLAHARGFGFLAGLPFRFDLGAATLSPYVGSQFAQVRNDGFSEAGASGFGLRAEAWNFDRWQAYAGLRASRDWQLADGFSFGIDGRAEWQRGLTDGNPLLASFTGIEQWMPVSGLSMARQGSLFGLGFNAQWRNGSLLRLDVSRRGSELGDHNLVNASYRYRF